MSNILLIIFATSLIALGGFVVYILRSQKWQARELMHRMVATQRVERGEIRHSEQVSALDIASKTSVNKKAATGDSRLTLLKKLRYAQWSVTPVQFHFIEAGVGLFIMLTIGSMFAPLVQLMTIVSGPIFLRWALTGSVERRFRLFDQDYAPFLLSVVGLLKTGMTAIGAIEAAAENLEDGSLLKLECELMMERLRFGVPEENSIGAFAEDIYHPEIELFVQAVLLSKRVGGSLSDTLDRLARQVRRRQYFRKQAQASVSMQRGSIWFILAIMTGLMLYLYFLYPEVVLAPMRDPMGWTAYQFGLVVIAGGILWIRQVTKMKL